MRKPVCVVVLILASLIGVSCGLQRLTPTGTPPSMLTAAPTAAETEASPSPDFSALLFRGPVASSSFLLLGGVRGGAWLSPDLAAEAIHGGEAYRFLSRAGRVGIGTGMAPTLDPICGSYVVPTDLASEEQNLVGVFSGWRVLRGTEEEVSPDEGIYQQAVRDWLTEHGVIRPEVRITRILRVDIETDGVDEAFISASHFAEPTGHTTQAGDYSIVLMRRVVLGTIRTIALVEEYYDSVDPILTFPRTYSLDHVMDLNDDGILDVVLGIQHWEGYGAQAYEISDQDVIQVLAAQCGL